MPPCLRVSGKTNLKRALTKMTNINRQDLRVAADQLDQTHYQVDNSLGS